MFQGYQGGEIDPIGWEGDLPTLQELEQQQQQLIETPQVLPPEVTVRPDVWDGRVKTLGNFTIGWGASFNDPWSDVPESD